MRRQNNCWRLQRYVGRDLLSLTDLEQKELDHCVESVVGPSEPVSPGKTWSFQNWLVCRSSGQGSGSRIFVVQVAPGFGIHSNTDMRIFFVDQYGRLIRSVTKKIHIGRVTLDETTHGFPCLYTEETGASVVPLRYCYSLAEDQLELIRIESLEGHFMLPGDGRIYYDSRNWSESKSLLMSPKVLDQLRALGCLSALTFELNSVLEENHRLRLKELVHSRDPWVKEEAQAFLNILEPPANTKDPFE